MLEVTCLADHRPVPASWVRLELEDFSSHSSYPAIVQEIKAGWINFYGRLPGQGTQHSSLSSIIRELVEIKSETEEVFRPFYMLEAILYSRMFQLRRVTVLSALEKDSYMTDMISLLSNFKFGRF